MKIQTSILAGLLAASVLTGLHAQTTDAPPVDPNAVLSKLGQIKQKQQADIKSAETTVAQTLMAKASSPTDAVNYYLAAIEATQFAGEKGEHKEFEDWTKRHEQEFKDPNFKTAVCLHLMYLSLAVSHDAGVKTKDLVPTLLSYIQGVQAYETSVQQERPSTAQPTPGNGMQGGGGGRRNQGYGQQQAQQGQQDQADSTAQKELMESPIAKSIFVRFLEIGQYVTDEETWEQVPIKVDGIFEKVILPEYRLERNSAGIFQYWDGRIQREEAEAGSLKRQVDIDKFNNDTKPSLQWQRAEEYVGLGLKNTAINAMVAIIDAHRYHPDAPAWIEEVEKLVKPPPAAPAAQQAPATGTAPESATAPAATNPGQPQPVQD